MCDNSFSVNFDNQVVAYAAYLVALAEFHHALMLACVNLERDYRALYQFAFAADGSHVVRLLAGLDGPLRRVESAHLGTRACVAPRPHLGQRSYLLPAYRLLSNPRHRCVC